jgi:hypothetical protein
MPRIWQASLGAPVPARYPAGDRRLGDQPALLQFPREAHRPACSTAGPSYLYNPDGSPKPIGTVLKNPDLARLLGDIATKGPDYFYAGASHLDRHRRQRPRRATPRR